MYPLKKMRLRRLGIKPKQKMLLPPQFIKFLLPGYLFIYCCGWWHLGGQNYGYVGNLTTLENITDRNPHLNPHPDLDPPNNDKSGSGSEKEKNNNISDPRHWRTSKGTCEMIDDSEVPADDELGHVVPLWAVPPGGHSHGAPAHSCLNSVPQKKSEK